MVEGSRLYRPSRYAFYSSETNQKNLASSFCVAHIPMSRPSKRHTLSTATFVQVSAKIMPAPNELELWLQVTDSRTTPVLCAQKHHNMKCWKFILLFDKTASIRQTSFGRGGRRWRKHHRQTVQASTESLSIKSIMEVNKKCRHKFGTKIKKEFRRWSMCCRWWCREREVPYGTARATIESQSVELLRGSNRPAT